MTTRGRPREFRNGAERQKAYRDRLKASAEQQTIMNEMLVWFQEQESALRNYVAYWEAKGKTVEITSAGTSNQIANVLVSGYSSKHIESAVWKYFLLVGVVVSDGSKGWQRTYTLCPIED